MLKGSLIFTLLACAISSSVALPYGLSDGKLVRRDPPLPDEPGTSPSEAAADPLKCVTDTVNVFAQTLGTAQQAISGVGVGSGTPGAADPFDPLNQALESCGYTIVKASPAGSVVKSDDVVNTVTGGTLGGVAKAVGGIIGQGASKGGQDTVSSPPADTATGGAPPDTATGGAPPDIAGGAPADTADGAPAGTKLPM